MKRTILLISILSVFCMLFSAQSVKEGKPISFKSGNDSLFVYYDNNFDFPEMIYPDKKGKFTIPAKSGSATVTVATPEDSFLEIYIIKKKEAGSVDIFLGDIYQKYGLIDSARSAYERAFEKYPNEYASYDKLTDFISVAVPESSAVLLEGWYEKNKTNINVLYKNSLLARNDDFEKYIKLTKEALLLKDTSITYFNVILNAIFDDTTLSNSMIEDMTLYAMKNFYYAEEFVFVVYNLMDKYSQDKFKKIYADAMIDLIGKDLSDELKFYMSVYFIDNSVYQNNALELLSYLVDRDIFDDYGGYILLYTAKAYYQLNDIENAEKYLTRTKSEFDLDDKEIFQMGYDIAQKKDDKKEIMANGVKLLSFNGDDKKLLIEISKLTGKTESAIVKAMKDLLESESDTVTLQNHQLTNLDDKSVEIKKYKGKAILIDFFATWCGPCKEEIKELNKLKLLYKNSKNVAFVAISSEDDAELIKTFAKEREFEFDIYYNGGSIMNAEQISGVPTVYIIDKNGKIRFKRVGYSPDAFDYLKTRIDFLTGKK